MTLRCYQDHILTEYIWFVCSETSYSGDERRCYQCGTNERTNEWTNERRTNIEDRATQPMEAGGWVSQFCHPLRVVGQLADLIRQNMFYPWIDFDCLVEKLSRTVDFFVAAYICPDHLSASSQSLAFHAWPAAARLKEACSNAPTELQLKIDNTLSKYTLSKNTLSENTL